MNLVSSPGSGKTSLLENTVDLKTQEFSVIEGTNKTTNDAERIYVIKRSRFSNQ